MTQEEWLTCTDPRRMLHTVLHKASERKLRLFAVATWHHIPHKDAYGRLVRAVDTAERYADGLASRQELLDGKSTALEIASRFQRLRQEFPNFSFSLSRVALLAAFACEERAIRLGQQILEAVSWEEFPPIAVSLIRDVFGDYLLSVPGDPLWLTSSVTRLARLIYDDRAFDRLSLLADALEDAGCHDSDILSHCRSGGEHVRGCWVIDQLLAKS